MFRSNHLNKELKTLASLWSTTDPLYAVGGCVRDWISNGQSLGDDSDIDLAGRQTPDELKRMLKGSQFALVEASAKLGTMIIKGSRNYEYTAFRSDSYADGSGEHTPTQVELGVDILTDARRRDFKCNAIYYDIIGDKVIDPLGSGVKQAKDKILETTIEPEIVLGQDGLRILRLFRFQSTLGYSIEPNTLQYASIMASRLNDISPERIGAELIKLLSGDNCLEALRGLRDSGVLKVIMPELAQNDKVVQNPKYHKYDVLEHIFHTVSYLPPRLRLVGLMHDIAKGYCLQRDGNMYMHAQEGARIAEQVLGRLKLSKSIINHCCRLVGAHMYDLKGNTKKSKLRIFIAKNSDIIDDLILLNKADGMATGMPNGDNKHTQMEQEWKQMQSQNIPMRITDLDIKGNDIIGLSGKDIGLALNFLWESCIIGNVDNNKSKLLDYLDKNIKSIQKSNKRK